MSLFYAPQYWNDWYLSLLFIDNHKIASADDDPPAYVQFECYGLCEREPDAIQRRRADLWHATGDRLRYHRPDRVRLSLHPALLYKGLTLGSVKGRTTSGKRVWPVRAFERAVFEPAHPPIFSIIDSGEGTMKRLLSIALVLLIALVAIAGCSGKNEGEGKAPGPSGQTGDSAGGDAKLEEVTLKIMIPGDRPSDMDLVIAEAEKRMKDTINVKLDVVFVPWSDLAQRHR